MKKKLFQEYKNKPIPEIQKELSSFKVKMSELKFAIASGKMKSLKEMKDVKKSIAQFETILSERKD